MKKRYSSARYAGSGTPVNRQAAVAVSSGSMRVGVKVENQGFRFPKDEELLPVPEDGKVSLRMAIRCKFVPKAVVFRFKRRWLEPMDWETAFDVTLEMLDEWFASALQFVDKKFLGTEIIENIDPQWSYCYFLRRICRVLEIDYDEIVFLAFVKKNRTGDFGEK